MATIKDAVRVDAIGSGKTGLAYLVVVQSHDRQNVVPLREFADASAAAVYASEVGRALATWGKVKV